MADYLWSTRSPVQKAFVAGRQGERSGDAGVRLTEVTGSIVQVMARRGQWAATAAAAKSAYGVAAPERPQAAFGKSATLVWFGPDQFFALTPSNGLASPLDAVRDAFAGVASLTDQSGGRFHMRVSGPRARDALAKVSSLDLHDSVFPVGTAAATSMDHTGVTLWRGPDADGSPAYDIVMFTSFADSLWHTIADAAAEYGIDTARQVAA